MVSAVAVVGAVTVGATPVAVVVGTSVVTISADPGRFGRQRA